MNVSISSIKESTCEVHTPLSNPMRCSKIYYLKERSKILTRQNIKKIGQSLRCENSWLTTSPQ